MTQKLLGNDDLSCTGHVGSPWGLFESWTASTTGIVTELRVETLHNISARPMIFLNVVGSPSLPGDLVAYGNYTAITTGDIRSLPMPNTTITAGTVYWLGAVGDGTGLATKGGYSGLNIRCTDDAASAYPYIPADDPDTDNYGTTYHVQIAAWGFLPGRACQVIML
jgi:hypothetical protein